MGWAADANEIQARFKAQMDVLEPSLKIAWQNGPEFPQPPGPTEFWLKFAVIEGSSFQAAFGTPRTFRTLGHVSVQVFYPLGVGTGRARAIADNVATALQGVRLASGLLLGATRVVDRDPGENDTHRQMNVLTDFDQDHFVS